MKSVSLGSGLSALVDDQDYSIVSKYSWYADIQSDKWIYAFRYARFDGPNKAGGRKHKRRYVSMHRAIMNATSDQIIDHSNGNGLDNQRANLRTCTTSQNAQNRHTIIGRSQYKGVCWHHSCSKWQAQIQTPTKRLYLGLFDVETEAARAYDAAAIEHFGEFAATNSKLMGLS